MAHKPGCLLLLLGLTLSFHTVTSTCNVTCSTDYDVLLNCSCASAVQKHPVLVQVICRGEDVEVNGSCEVEPLQSWCTMHLDELYLVASIGTLCNTTVIQQDDQGVNRTSVSPRWSLSDMVKPQPPSNVQVTNSDAIFNITWKHHNKDDCLIYTVRIRENKDLSKDPVHSLSTDQTYIHLHHNKLQPNVNYSVDVRGKMCEENLYRGPWSEWSATAELRMTGTSVEDQGKIRTRIYIAFASILVLGFLYLQKLCVQKTVRLVTYFPKPNEFFKPLYLDHGGNFKEWVKPAFSEYDYLRINSLVQMMGEKQHDILQWTNKKQSNSEDIEAKEGEHFPHTLQPHSNMLMHYQDGGSSQGTSHSMGHISIHTVTLSGEEFEEEAMSQSSINTIRSYQDGGSLGSFEEDKREHAGYNLEGPQLSGMDRQSGMLPENENRVSNELLAENVNFQLRAQFNEPERLSLDSFASNEQSEDGYPHVDLDTIDSGFVECSSPGASDSNRGEQIDSDLFHEHKNSNSNYVKQWMIYNTIQENSSTSENELRETQ